MSHGAPTDSPASGHANTVYRATNSWQLDGWQSDTIIGVDAGGRLSEGRPSERSGVMPPSLGQWVLPGMPNLHSHAFQRAMAGLAERRSRIDDSFWSWREIMYGFAAAISPEALQAIAAQLYVEMLKAGYTQVCEFHYLHHQPDGTPYTQPEAMSLALIEAAREAGIALTLLPVLYMSGGFDGRALAPRQCRFGNSVDSYLRLLQSLRAYENEQMRVGIALHSLRAVPVDAMHEVLASEAAQNCPIHIHVAEQIGEVQDCLALRGARPVEWLLDNAKVDARWCLVHATHLTDTETTQLAASGAVAGLCPTTEANLGDGLFPLADYLDAGGSLGIGSDSHISISPVEELRWLEYGQRLISRHRNIGARRAGASVGETLWRAALHGGAQASGLPLGELATGMRADLLVLDEQSPLLAARDTPSVIDSFLFAGNTPLVRHVMCGGEWVVRDFHHRDEERIAARYRDAVTTLAAS
jgi:formimidoylglutamate deiminase